MYLVTQMNWSDVAMGDDNPQTKVKLCATLEDAKQAVIDSANESIPEELNLPKVETFEQAVEFLRDAPETPEIDIQEIHVGMDFVYLSRQVLKDEVTMANALDAMDADLEVEQTADANKVVAVVHVEKFAGDVKRALDNALDNSYDLVDDDSGAIAEDIVELDADLEGFPPALLIPHIEYWQKLKRIEQNRQKEN